MIFCDDRIGSEHLAPILVALGHPVSVTRLEFGDVVFAGNGPNGTAVQVALELKKLPDLLGSFASGRFTNHQLPGLTAGYDQCWLIIEGRYRAGANGILEWANERAWKDDTTICNWSDAGYGFRRWMYRELEGRLTTLQVKAGIRVTRTSSADDTARFIGALYEWWTASEYAEHRSHTAAALKAQMAMLRPPSFKERVAVQFPHLGGGEDGKAVKAAAAFANVREMVNASVETWMSLPGVGAKIARDIVAAVSGGK